MESYRIPRAEYIDRQETLRKQASSDNFDGVVLFTSTNIQYITGFYAVTTNRPTVVLISEESVGIVVPKLENVHIDNNANFVFDEVYSYYEHPQSDPMEKVEKMVRDFGLTDATLAVDAIGPATQFGYRGPSLENVIEADLEKVYLVEDMRRIKSENELELYREGAKWVTYAQRLLQNTIDTGKRPLVVSEEVETSANRTMLDALGDRYKTTQWAPPIEVTFTSGKNTAYCHTTDQTTPIEEGDNIETFVMASMDNYVTGKLERTMFMGPPSDEQRHYFEIVKEAQDLLFNSVKAGMAYSKAEDIVDEYFDEHGLKEKQHHHPGHGLGLEILELPFLDRGVEGEFSVGEVFTIEPGIYIEGLGGFRHCDTVTATENGVEKLNFYPRTIDELTIPMEK